MTTGLPQKLHGPLQRTRSLSTSSQKRNKKKTLGIKFFVQGINDGSGPTNAFSMFQVEETVNAEDICHTRIEEEGFQKVRNEKEPRMENGPLIDDFQDGRPSQIKRVFETASESKQGEISESEEVWKSDDEEPKLLEIKDTTDLVDRNVSAETPQSVCSKA